MATGTTRLADLVVPAIWYPYFYEQSAKTSALIKSGILEMSAENNAIAANKGLKIDVPFTRPLVERPSAWKADGTNTTTAEKILTGQMAVPIIRKKHKLGWNDLATHIAGLREFVSMGNASWGFQAQINPGDTSAALAMMMTNLWNEDLQQTLIAALEGCFASTTNVANVSDEYSAGLSSMVLDASITTGTITANNRISPATMGAAAGLLGEYSNQLMTLVVHPNVYHLNLLPANITPNLQTSSQQWRIPTYLDYQIILDKTLPVDNTTVGYPKYTSYLFAPGSVKFGDAVLDPIVGAELDRNADQGEDFLFTRRMFVIQPKAMSYVGAVPATGEGPGDTALANGSNWSRADHPSNIGLVKIVTNG